MLLEGELKSIGGQSVGEDRAGLQLVEKLATPLTTSSASRPHETSESAHNETVLLSRRFKVPCQRITDETKTKTLSTVLVYTK